MPRVVVSADERHELEQALQRLEAEQRTLTDEVRRGSAQDPQPPDTLQRHAALENRTFVEGRVRQLRALLAAAVAGTGYE